MSDTTYTPSTSDPRLAATANRVANVFNGLAILSVIGAALLGLLLAVEAESFWPIIAAAIYGTVAWATFEFYSIIASYIEHRVK